MILKYRGENFYSEFLHSEFYGAGRVSSYAATPLIIALSPGHNDITRFRQWPAISTGNHLDRAEKIAKFAQTTGTADVFESRSVISGPTLRRASTCPNLHK